MCGILGSVNAPFGDTALDLIRHRGPDGSGIAQRTVGPHTVTIGQRRLAILDLSEAGSQPMWTSDGRWGMVFNGEIYNHRDLRAELGSIEYRGHSDTETILHYLGARGILRADRLNGIFALCLVDTVKKRMYLARDSFGVKPLYYRLEGTTLIFASELRAIRAFYRDSLDAMNLAELLRLRYLPAPDTLFRNVRKLRPGHIAEVDLSGARLGLTEYPYIAPAREVAQPGNRREAVEQYGSLLKAAVKRQLQSDVEIGVLLSGGVDSALVASIAQANAPYRMKAFTVGFTEETDTDEIREAAESARSAGLEHQYTRIGEREFLELLPRVGALLEEPLATTSVVPMYHLSRLAAKSVKVTLSGQGADEAMGGYRRYQLELLGGMAPRFAAPALKKLAKAARIRNDAVLRGLDAWGDGDDVRRFESVYGVFSRERIRRMTGVEASRAADRIGYFFNLLGCAEQRRSVERMMSLDLRMSLADDLLLYTDKITMRHSIECRVPLLDLELVRYLESLPAKYRVGIARGKRIHKWFAKTMLPEAVLKRPKKGFLSPAARWMRGAAREMLTQRNARLYTYLDRGEVEAVLREQETGANRERHVFLLLTLHYWMNEFLAPEEHSDYAVAV